VSMTEMPLEGSITARGPVSGVTVHSHMRSGPHALTECPLDLAVVVELMFLFAEQGRRAPDETPLRITPQSVLERLQTLGVRSGNGARLVGSNAVYDSFARLRAKGYLRRIVISDEKTGQRTGVVYEFYDWPAWNPEAPAGPDGAPIGEFSQVGPTSGNATSGIATSGNPGSGTKNASPQVVPTSGNATSGNAGSRPKPQVVPTSGNAGTPPHPPEVVVTTSPYPLNATDGSRQNGEEGESSASNNDEQRRAAYEFLQDLPDPWSAGRATARKLAPELIEAITQQGWQLDDKLVKQLTGNAEGIKRYPSVLAKRIADLPRRGRSGTSGAAQDRCPDHPARYLRGCPECAMAVPA